MKLSTLLFLSTVGSVALILGLSIPLYSRTNDANAQLVDQNTRLLAFAQQITQLTMHMSGVTLNETLILSGTFDWRFVDFVNTDTVVSPSSQYSLYRVNAGGILTFYVLELTGPVTPFTFPFDVDFYLNIRLQNFVPAIPYSLYIYNSIGQENVDKITLPCRADLSCDFSNFILSSVKNLGPFYMEGQVQQANSGAGQAFSLSSPWRLVLPLI